MKKLVFKYIYIQDIYKKVKENRFSDFEFPEVDLNLLFESESNDSLFNDTGRVISIGDGIATCTGLLNIQAGEMVVFT